MAQNSVNWLVKCTLKCIRNYFVTYWVRLGDKPLETHEQHSFQLNTCGHIPYVTSSLTRRWVCSLQLLLALTKADILRSESSGSHEHILLSQIGDSPTCTTRSLYLYPLWTGWPSYTPRHCVPFPSPSATRRATVEVFLFSRYSLRTDATQIIIRLLVWVT
jgi:hypothetical protein